MEVNRFAEYLKATREKKGMSISQLASNSGVSAAQISRIESGLRGVPKPETIQKLAEALNERYENLMIAAGYMDEVLMNDLIEYMEANKEEGEEIDHEDIRNRINSFSTKAKLNFYEVINDWKDRKDGSVVKESIAPYNIDGMRRLPVLGSIRAGTPIDRIEYNEGYTLVDPDLLRGKEGFALRVKGDSMSGDRILDGDIVIVAAQPEVQPHEIAVVAVNGDEATLKRVKLHGDMVMLVPSNPAYEPQLVPAKDVYIIGKVVEVKFWPK